MFSGGGSFGKALDELGKYEFDPEKVAAITAGTGEQFDKVIRHTAEEVLSAVDPMIPGKRYHADPGKLYTVGTDKPGSPIIYVNGIGTSPEMAIEEAKALSDSTGRPVEIMYNHSASESGGGTGIIQDGVDSFTDAFTDATGVDASGAGVLTEWLMDAGEHVALRTTPAGAGFDRMTNKLMTRIRERHEAGDRDIMVVTQSGGNGDMKSALEGFSQTKETHVFNSLSWYSTGTPLTPAEVPKEVDMLKGFIEIKNDGDIVTNVAGLRDPLKGGNMDDHIFTTAYAGKVGLIYKENKAQGMHPEEDTAAYEGGFDCFGTGAGSTSVAATPAEPEGFDCFGTGAVSSTAASSEPEGFSLAGAATRSVEADPGRDAITAALAETASWGDTGSLDPAAVMAALQRDFSTAIGGSGVSSSFTGSIDTTGVDIPDEDDLGLGDLTLDGVTDPGW